MNNFLFNNFLDLNKEHTVEIQNSTDPASPPVKSLDNDRTDVEARTQTSR